MRRSLGLVLLGLLVFFTLSQYWRLIRDVLCSVTVFRCYRKHCSLFNLIASPRLQNFQSKGKFYFHGVDVKPNWSPWGPVFPETSHKEDKVGTDVVKSEKPSEEEQNTPHYPNPDEVSAAVPPCGCPRPASARAGFLLGSGPVGWGREGLGDWSDVRGVCGPRVRRRVQARDGFAEVSQTGSLK